MVEFALVAVLLVLLVLGIVNYGLILSFKQDMTRAAAEGARAGAVALPVDEAWLDADTATRQAVDEFGQTCGVDGMECNINRHACNVPVAPGTPSDPLSTGECVTVELVYDYASHPLLAKPPLLAALLPETIRDSSVARLNS